MQGLVNTVNKITKDIRCGYHVTLGTLVEVLERVQKFTPSRLVELDAGPSPFGPHSYRGHYSDLALDSQNKPITVSELLKLLKPLVGKKLVGYKGGEYLMTNDTPLWVAEYGELSNVAIVDIQFESKNVILVTKTID